MEQNTKSIITLEKCQQELMRITKATLPLTVLFFVICTVAGIIFLAVDSENFLGDILLIVLGIVCIGTAVLLAYFHISSYIKIKKGRIEIREDSLAQTAVETVRRRTKYGYTYREQKVFYFADHGRYVITEKDGEAFQYSAEGDRFYLLLYCGEITPLRIYNEKVYEYRE